MKSKAFVVYVCALAFVASGQTTFNATPTRVFGPARLSTPPTSANPNLVEGREFYQPQGIAFDTTTNPPTVYVADYRNNRVLGWKNSAAFENGAVADIVVGQRDRFSTNAQGPGRAGSDFASGLAGPSAVAVDPNGNLYVADTGNNRILRFPKPATASGIPTADMVIGQVSLSSAGGPNQGLPAPTASTLYIGQTNNVYPVGMAFDPNGNLWVTDTLNNRVLRYSAANLAAGGTVNADVALGQPNMTTGSAPSGNDRTPYNKGVTVQPTAVAVSPSGDIYVADGYGRVLFYRAGTATLGAFATRVLGVLLPNRTAPQPAALYGCPAATPDASCGIKLGANSGGTVVTAPTGVAVAGNRLWVADYGNHRVVGYDSPDRWQTECVYSAGMTAQDCPVGTAFSPAPIAYLGQNNSGTSVKPNQGSRNPGSHTLSLPWGVAANGGDLWVSDSGNHRVLVFPSASSSASRVLGQTDMTMSSPNLVEGRELNMIGGVQISGSQVLTVAGTAVVDPGTNRMYVADTFNHRVLGFSDYRKVTTGARADIVIGQADFNHSIPNYESTGDASVPSSGGLAYPTGLAIDANGDLWVADTFNGRVLRFPAPFAQTGGIRANLVLGKSTMTVRPGDQNDPSPNTMRLPFGVAFGPSGVLAISDLALNRVLLFRKPAGGDFTSYQAADAVIGQPDFTTVSSGNQPSNLNGPRGVAFDTSERVYVADTGNNRISVFRTVGLGPTEYPSAGLTQSVGGVQSVAVSPQTGEIWVTNFNGNQLVRFPVYDQWALNPSQVLSVLALASPYSVTLDPFSNPLAADAYQRLAFFYPQAVFKNAASYNSRALTPGMLAVIAPLGPSIGVPDAVADAVPFPTVLSGIRVTVNGTPAPIYYVQSGVIAIQVPWEAPTSGRAELIITNDTTGQVLGAGSLQMDVASPAIFTSNLQGSGQVAALNEDSSVNGPNNGAAVGSVIAIYGTGLGRVNGAPPTGEPNPSTPVDAPEKPRVIIGNRTLDAADVLYFGLAPGLVGGFQLNVRIPAGTAPGNQVVVGFFYKDIQSTYGPPQANGQPSLVRTTITVK